MAVAREKYAKNACNVYSLAAQIYSSSDFSITFKRLNKCPE